MVEIQLGQMSMVKMTNRFRLQAYLGAIIIDYKNQAFWFSNRLLIKKRVAFITSIGREDTHLENSL